MREPIELKIIERLVTDLSGAKLAALIIIVAVLFLGYRALA